MACTNGNNRETRVDVGAPRPVFRGPPRSAPGGSVAVLEAARNTRVPIDVAGEIAYDAVQPVRYWGESPVATDGWYRTGDSGYIDAHGRVFVTGRLKELINRGGLKVACGEIEEAIRDLTSVADCAVVPTPDAVLGEAICACVVPGLNSAPTLVELRSLLGETLARHKLPDELCLVSSIPRTSLGKVDRKALTAHIVSSDLPRTGFRDDATVGSAAAANGDPGRD